MAACFYSLRFSSCFLKASSSGSGVRDIMASDCYHGMVEWQPRHTTGGHWNGVRIGKHCVTVRFQRSNKNNNGVLWSDTKDFGFLLPLISSLSLTLHLGRSVSTALLVWHWWRKNGAASIIRFTCIWLTEGQALVVVRQSKIK